MLFAVIFRDKPGSAALRAEWLAAHIRWLDGHADTVRVAGSLRTEPADVPLGALWIVEAASKDAVLGLVRSDPFSACGLRESVEVLHWSKAFPDRRVPV